MHGDIRRLFGEGPVVCGVKIVEEGFNVGRLGEDFSEERAVMNQFVSNAVGFGV